MGNEQVSRKESCAKYGTGYCDAQCPHNLKFINGEANCREWEPSNSDKNSGTGYYGNEMDIWESSRISTAYTPHVCTVRGQTWCEGSVEIQLQGRGTTVSVTKMVVISTLTVWVTGTFLVLQTTTPLISQSHSQ